MVSEAGCRALRHPAFHVPGAYPGVALTHAQIDDRSRECYFFEVFLTPDFSRVIACFGVAGTASNVTAGLEKYLAPRRWRP